ncbi:MAG: M20/M25/M40 family metallo-hydrolase [Polyangiaceae bacterium]|nr:M20/M25/M40 family metallo-hydrolase [Polyangiaceae bacterium]
METSDLQRVTDDVKRLASDDFGGRGTGDKGAQLAAELIEQRFKELGLEPFGDGDGAAKQFRNKFSARVGAKSRPPKLDVSRAKQKPTALADGASITADGSESGEAQGVVVFVGHGVTAPAVTWDDYAGKEIAGKVALVLDGAPAPADDKQAKALRDFKSARYKLRTAREHKAAGVIIVAAGEELPLEPADARGMGVPGVVIKRSVAKQLFPDIKWDDVAKTASKAAVKPRELAGVNVKMTTRIEPTMADAWNVVARLPAKSDSPTASEYVVIGAHYDHLGMGGTSSSRAPGTRAIHHGADDNASGTSLLLDVARRLSKLPEKSSRSVVFIAFGAEELGTLGSRHWVEHPPVPMTSIVAMINADMVGRMRERTLVVDGTGTSAAWTELLQKANEGLSLNLKLGAEGFGASDHAPFTAARVPVAFLFTGVHDDYHLPSDTAEKIDVGGIDLAATLAARLTLAVAQRPERLVFVDPPSTDPHRGGGSGTGRGFKVSLGTIPDYAWQGKGVKLTGARPDSPALRAGLQAGDVIVKLGTHDITNVHDYVYALQELEPGRETTVEVEREGKRLPLKIIPAPGR